MYLKTNVELKPFITYITRMYIHEEFDELVCDIDIGMCLLVHCSCLVLYCAYRVDFCYSYYYSFCYFPGSDAFPVKYIYIFFRK